MLTVFIDMDGVIANIHEKIGYSVKHSEKPKEIMEIGFYETLNIMPGALKVIKWLLNSKEIDLWIATKTPSDNYHAASEKVQWLHNHIPELKNRCFITPDKTLLKGDVLIDDDLKWAKFDGEFIHFDYRNPNQSWNRALERIKNLMQNSKRILIQNSEKGTLLVNKSKTDIKRLTYETFVLDRCTHEDMVISHTEHKTIKNLKAGEGIIIDNTFHYYKDACYTLTDVFYENGEFIEEIDIYVNAFDYRVLKT